MSHRKDFEIKDGRNAAGTMLGRPEKKPLPKRFYAEAAVEAAGSGFRVVLDRRAIKTPGKLLLAVPTAALAEAIAGEWRAQAITIDPHTMPLTRLANTALDGVSGREAEVAEDIVSYAASDLLCYRAESPEGLVRRQSAAWDPVLAWASAALGADMRVAPGIMPVTQSPGALERIRSHVTPLDALRLTALHVMTTLMGSGLLALATAKGRLTAEQAWACAHVDEDWQISQWGTDGEAAARREHRWQEMQAAARFLKLLE